MLRLPKTTAQRQRDAVASAIDGYIAAGKRNGRDSRAAAGKRNGRDSRAAAAALGVPYITLWRRLKSPEDFTLGELQSIANTLNISLPALLGGQADGE